MTRFISILILIFVLAACSDGPVNSSMDQPERTVQLQSSSDITEAASTNNVVEVVEIDARLIGTAGSGNTYAFSTNTLEAGVEYRLTVDGNWSAWLPSWWVSCDGKFPVKHVSPSVPDGIHAGFDAEGRFAVPGSHSHGTPCSSDMRRDNALLFSLDGGDTFFNPAPTSGAGSFNSDHVYEYILTGQGKKAAFFISDTREDNHGIMKVTIEEIVTEVTVFTSDPSVVDSWGPILEDPLLSHWPQACTVIPAVGLDDPRWGSPQASYEVGPASFEGWTPWAGFNAPWINAWNSIEARDAPGAKYGNDTQSWAKFASTVSGDGDFVIQFLADNCSWIYLDGTLIGFQGNDWNTNPAVDGRYTLSLSGTHTLSFIIFDGGGQAGGKYRLETFKSYVDGGGDLDDINPPLPTDDTPPVIEATVSGTLGNDGWYTSDVSVSWSVTDPESDISSSDGCELSEVIEDTDGITFTCTATSAGGTASESVTIKRDATPPVISFQGNAENYLVNDMVEITCESADATSGIATSDCPGASGAAYTFGLGTTTLEASAIDNAGNGSTGSTEFNVSVTSGSLCSLVRDWVSQRGVANALCQQLNNGAIQGFQNTVRAQTGRHIPAEYADYLLNLSEGL